MDSPVTVNRIRGTQQQGGQGAGGMAGGMPAPMRRTSSKAGRVLAESSGVRQSADAGPAARRQFRVPAVLLVRPGGNGQAGYPGGPAGGGGQGPGGQGQDNGPADVHTPEGAVRAFLNALQAKDRDRLAEATALHSQTEATTEKNKELFGKIVDLSISDAEMDDLAKKLHGYRIGGENAAKRRAGWASTSTRRTDEGSMLRLTLTVRKEKKGWGVMDMTNNPLEFKPMGNMNQEESRRRQE